MRSPENRTPLLFGLSLTGLFAVLAIFFCRPIEDYDIWFYMVPGREIAATGRIPDTMFYLLPLLGEPASYIEWGFGLLYYWAYTLGGYRGMTALNACLGALTLLLAYRAAINNRQTFHPAALLGLAIVSWWITARMNYRAETMLLLSMAVTLFTLERYADQGNWRWLITIPIVGFLLIQMHPSVLLLLPALGAYAIELSYSPPSGLTRLKVAFTFLTVVLVTLAIACINPYGWTQVMLPFVALLSGDSMRADINEYLPVMDTEYASSFLVMLTLGFLSLLVQHRRIISGAILLLLYGFLTFLYARNIGLFALVLLGPLVHLALKLFPDRISTQVQKFCMIAVLVVWLGLPVLQGRLGSGVASGVFPEKSALFLKQHMSSGNVLNFYDYGGYLAWALGSHFLVFVDGHDIKSNRAVQLHDSIFLAESGWENKVAYYRINAIFTPAVMKFSGRMIPLVERLAKSTDWRLVVREPSGLLFLRADMFTETALERSQVWEQMIEEARQEIHRFPDHPDSWAALVMAYREMGDHTSADDAARQYRRLSESKP